MLAHLIIARIAKKAGAALVSGLDVLIEPLRTAINSKPKGEAVQQQVLFSLAIPLLPFPLCDPFLHLLVPYLDPSTNLSSLPLIPALSLVLMFSGRLSVTTR